MNLKRDLNLDLQTGFWLGVVVISLINIVLVARNQDQIAFDWYILTVSIILIIVFTIMRSLSKKRRR